MMSALHRCITQRCEAHFADALTWLLSYGQSHAALDSSLPSSANTLPSTGTSFSFLPDFPLVDPSIDCGLSADAEHAPVLTDLITHMKSTQRAFAMALKESHSQTRALACLSIVLQACWSAACSPVEPDAINSDDRTRLLEVQHTLVRLVAAVMTACIAEELNTARVHFSRIHSVMCTALFQAHTSPMDTAYLSLHYANGNGVF